MAKAGGNQKFYNHLKSIGHENTLDLYQRYSMAQVKGYRKQLVKIVMGKIKTPQLTKSGQSTGTNSSYKSQSKGTKAVDKVGKGVNKLFNKAAKLFD